MHEWARRLKAKTDAGAMLFFDGELWCDPKWRITKKHISFTSGSSTQVLLDRGDDPAEVEAILRGRLRVLVDAFSDG